MNTSRRLPEWLLQATSTENEESTWRILQARENKRSCASFGARFETRSHRLKKLMLHQPPPIDEAAAKRYSTAIGSIPQNKVCNRYGNIIPYDHNRVTPPGYDGRYVNCSWVQEIAGGQWWLATQAPLPHTAHSFLSLLTTPLTPPNSSQGSLGRYTRTVVQLTPEIERGIRKADPYFSNTVGESWSIEPEYNTSLKPLEVRLEEQKHLYELSCVQSRVSIRTHDATQDHVVNHLLFTAWPDHGVPQDPRVLVNFLRYVLAVNQVMRDDGSIDEPPIIVGCSAGVGRTGSFLAISSLLRYFGAAGTALGSNGLAWVNTSPLDPMDEKLSQDLIAREIDGLREQRVGMVQTPEQLHLIYKVVKRTLEGHQRIASTS